MHEGDEKRTRALQQELRALKQERDQLQAEMGELSKANVDTSHRMSRLESQAAKCEAENQGRRDSRGNSNS